MRSKIKIPKVFEPLFREQLTNFREIFYKGGRGSGKTTNAVIYLALKFIKEPKTNILCLREYAKSTANSVKAEFDVFFQDNGFDSIFIEDGVISYSERKRNKDTLIKIKTTTITNTLNNNKIIFAGITRHSVRALKSLKGIKYCFIDESDFLGEAEYRILKPTIRAENSQIICCFNPKSEDDYIYKLSQEQNDRRYSKVVNYSDNPFFPKVLDDDRKDDLQRLPYPIYAHIWLGYPLENVEGVIFSKETIELMKQMPTIKTFYRERYSVVCIACDPATTNKDFSNEYGIIVLGLRSDGIVEIIDDLSGNKTPEQFVSAVDSGYKEFECDYVVVETNQGGDFIKHSIITKNPLIKVKEVRAIKDKVNRATPVANVASLGKVVLANENREFLIRQMRRLTNMGYFGAKGESPDRLDAMIWGVYDLLDISQYDTKGTLFKPDMFSYEIQGIIAERFISIYTESNLFSYIEFLRYDCLRISRFKILDSGFGYVNALDDFVNRENLYYFNESELTYQLSNNKNLMCYFLDNIKDSELDDKAQSVANIIIANKILDTRECKESEFENKKGVLIDKELVSYKVGSDNKSIMIKNLCAIILNYF